MPDATRAGERHGKSPAASCRTASGETPAGCSPRAEDRIKADPREMPAPIDAMWTNAPNKRAPQSNSSQWGEEEPYADRSHIAIRQAQFDPSALLAGDRIRHGLYEYPRAKVEEVF